ncbi:hypothetical protein ACCUM_2445 [Candidatus Accumulibacter phosphatis]|uniref:Uncharacterized protein n=1 Tax=Candidatus Accumulibacter phosphatis TaxID=327160 RepID=A0A5S4ERG6_9PROT|nr:hypothetical protein ACCUM_2445 [Candidatus Accumulibacter phosphatis]
MEERRDQVNEQRDRDDGADELGNAHIVPPSRAQPTPNAAVRKKNRRTPAR